MFSKEIKEKQKQFSTNITILLSFTSLMAFLCICMFNILFSTGIGWNSNPCVVSISLRILRHNWCIVYFPVQGNTKFQSEKKLCNNKCRYKSYNYFQEHQCDKRDIHWLRLFVLVVAVVESDDLAQGWYSEQHSNFLRYLTLQKQQRGNKTIRYISIDEELSHIHCSNERLRCMNVWKFQLSNRFTHT